MINSNFNVLSVRMSNAYFAMCDNDYEGEIETQIETRHAFADNGENKAKTELILNVFPDTEKTAPFRVEIKMEGIFTWDDSLKGKVEDFMEVNAMALLYSYARPIVTQLTTAANCTPLILPMMNFTSKTAE